MHLGLRLLFAFLAITGLAAFFVLRLFVTEIKPSVREVLEDVMVDAAHLLAEVATPELAALPEGGVMQGGALARAVDGYRARGVSARIWDLHKTSLDLRVTVADARGRVVFDSGTPSAVGQDHSRWRDVLLTLRGEYGARMSADPARPEASVMVVAAPLRQGDRLLGVLSVSKPMHTVAPFIERAEHKVLWAGVWLFGLSLAIGVAVTLWTVHSVRRLRRYALQVGDRDPLTPAPVVPALGGELGELARAMDHMRQRLQGREQLEQQVRALTHELKSPLAAIRGAAELLQEPLPAADRLRFAQQVDQQALRMQTLVEQLLELSKLEGLGALPQPEAVALADLTDQVLQEHAAALQQRRITSRWLDREACSVRGDRGLLALAISNLLANVLRHTPAGTAIELQVHADENGHVCWSLRDHGPGVPDYALAQLGERFFSTASGADARGSGLGLAIVRRVLHLHGAQLTFDAADPGLRVSLRF